MPTKAPSQLPLSHWTEHSINTTIASMFRNVGMADIDDCKEYLDIVSRFHLGYLKLDEAITAGIHTAAELRSFAAVNVEPSLAARFKMAHLSPGDVQRWLDAGITAENAAVWVEAGLMCHSTASAWETAAGQYAVDLFEAGFQLDRIPPVDSDRVNSGYYRTFKEQLILARRDNLVELYLRLVRVYACPTFTLRAARQERHLVKELIELEDSVLRTVLVIFEQADNSGGESRSPETVRSLIRQFT